MRKLIGRQGLRPAVFSMILLLTGVLNGCGRVLPSASISVSALPDLRGGINSGTGSAETAKTADGGEMSAASTGSNSGSMPGNLELALAEKHSERENHNSNLTLVFSGSEAGAETSNQVNSLEMLQLDPVPAPLPAGTAVRPYYETTGEAPATAGLAMRRRSFHSEPAKVAYLTIDDGPYPETTPKILEILKQAGVHATFFVLGRQVEHNPGLLRAEYEQGNAIGNHTYSHDYQLLYQSPDAFLADLKKSEEIIYKTIGIRPVIIRAPGGTQGHFQVRYYNVLDAIGYLVFDWNVSAGDASAPLVPTELLVKNVINQTTGKNRVIILLHDTGNKVTTVEGLPKIIAYLKSQDYAFGILSPSVMPILFPKGFSN